MKKLRKNDPRRLRLQKYAPLAVTAFAAFTLFTSLFRPFWFDEVLTVSLVKYFSPSGGPVAIYQAYDIPNNHIAWNGDRKSSRSSSTVSRRRRRRCFPSSC